MTENLLAGLAPLETGLLSVFVLYSETLLEPNLNSILLFCRPLEPVERTSLVSAVTVQLEWRRRDLLQDSGGWGRIYSDTALFSLLSWWVTGRSPALRVDCSGH